MRRRVDCTTVKFAKRFEKFQSTKRKVANMPSYTYLILGGGMTAAAAIGGIREADSSGSIGLIGNESHPPFSWQVKRGFMF
jgi:hypothetical protein